MTDESQTAEELEIRVAWLEILYADLREELVQLRGILRDLEELATD